MWIPPIESPLNSPLWKIVHLENPRVRITRYQIFWETYLLVSQQLRVEGRPCRSQRQVLDELMLILPR